MPGSTLSRLRLWCLLLALICAGFALQLAQGLRLETDLLGLLPAAGRDAATEQAQSAFAERSARRLILLVGAGNAADSRRAADSLALSLRQSGAFESVQLELETGWAQAARDYAPYRLGLLSDRHRDGLARQQSGRLRDEALRALYAPTSLARPIPAVDDLLGLQSDFLLQQAVKIGRARVSGGVLMIEDAGQHWAMVQAQTARSAFAMDSQQDVLSALQGAEQAMRQTLPDARLLRSGVVLHAHAAASRAKSEMTLFGSISGVGVIALMWLTFRSLRPLGLSLMSLGFGAVAGLAACQLAFGSVHLITLVFGTSLIGVAVDYSLHFFSDQFRDPQGWTPAGGVKHVGEAIFMGHLAAVLGYSALLIAPLPGVRQMALFSIVGLIVACGCVLCLYPVLARVRADARVPLALRAARALGASRFRFGRSRGHVLAALALAAFAVGGLARLQFQDDIRLMQSSPPTLIDEDRQVQALLGTRLDGSFFLVRGGSAEQLLQREEALRAELDGIKSDGGLGEYLAVSRALPSQQRQRENRELQVRQVLSAEGSLPQLLRSLNAEPAAIAVAVASFDPDAPLLTPATWLEWSSAAPLRPLWIGAVAGTYVSVVTLSDTRDAAALQTLPDRLPGVQRVDRVSEVSDILRQYREVAGALTVLVYALIVALLALRYGLRGALMTVLPPVAASLLVLAMLGWLGIAASLFNVLALLLVLGMGVDYAVFLREGRRTQTTVLLAIGLSALTTLLSFGLLALSATPFIRAIGLTLAPGIALIFLLAVWLGPAQAQEPARC